VTTSPTPDRPVNDMRELYAVQHAITDAGGTLAPEVHKAIDELREVWDRELRRAQAEAHQYRTALQGGARNAAAAPAASPVSVVSGQTLRDRVVAALADALKPRYGGPQHNTPGGLPLTATEEEIRLHRAQPLAAAVLAVLPPDGHTTNRADVLLWAADVLWNHPRATAIDSDFRSASDVLRRLAAEARGPWTADDRLKPHAVPAATTPDVPSMTGGFDDSIEIPELAAGAPQPEPAAGVRQQPDTETPSPTDEDFAVAIDSVLDRLLPAIGVSALERTRDQLGGVLRPLVEQLRRERDLAIAHDRQPYPTAWAYEQACKALHRKTDALDRVREFLKRHEHRVAVSPLDVLALLDEPAAVVPAAGAGQDETQEGDRG